MTWLSVIASVLAVLQSLTGYLRDRSIIDGATADLMLQGMKDAADAIAKANAARELVRADHARDPDSRLHDDGFRRD